MRQWREVALLESVLLHEVVHHTVFESPHPAAEAVLAWLNAVPSGITSR